MNSDLSTPSWVKSAVAVLSKSVPKVVSTFTREEKKQHNYAGYTCKLCPSPMRPMEVYKTKEVWSMPTKHCGGKYVRTTDTNRFGEIRTTWLYTKRCTECSRLMKRFTRAKNKVKRLSNVKAHSGHDISFVTLTFPNWKGEPLEGVRWMKKQVASFREQTKKIVVGGFDFYEYTDVDHAEYNVHSHSLWVMPYWEQKSLQKAWEEHLGLDTAIVHIRRCGQPWKHKKTGKWMKGDSEKDSLFYAIKYGGKDSIKGIRLSQSFGLCYGKEYAHVEESCLAKIDE